MAYKDYHFKLFSGDYRYYAPVVFHYGATLGEYYNTFDYHSLIVEAITWAEETIGPKGLAWDCSARELSDGLGRYQGKVDFVFQDKAIQTLFKLRFG